MSTEMSMNTDKLQAIENEAYRQYRELRAMGYVPQAACYAVSFWEDPRWMLSGASTEISASVENCRRAARESETETENKRCFYAKLAGIRRAMDEEVSP